MHQHLPQLKALADFCRLETEFHDGLGQFRKATPEAVVSVLRGLGLPLDRLEDVDSVLYEVRRTRLERLLPPILVGWEGRPLEVSLVLPADVEPRGWLRFEGEGGSAREVRIETLSWPGREPSSNLFPTPGLPPEDWIGEMGFRSYRLHWEVEADPGYHRLNAEVAGQAAVAHVLVAPPMAPRQAPGQWGVFLPLYALRTEKSWGVGNFGDLEELAAWTASLGGSVVGTLPLFSAFMEQPFSPSPYTPVSRLFWNELFLDPRRCVGFGSPAVQKLIASRQLREEIAAVRAGSLVDYRSAYSLQKRVLLELTRAAPRRELDLIAREFPMILEYARFRGRVEAEGPDLRRWAEGEAPDRIEGQSETVDYHLYAQWQCRTQLDQLLASSRARGVELYLDLPLGVHPDGFDAWRWPESFATGVSGGSPPDGFFTAGQDWGFQPLHPERSREDGYAYVRQVVSNLTRSAGIVRIDHAMSLQRLYWVPVGMSATQGVYVHYRTEELLAVLLIEAARNQCVLVGEDLGTVTPRIRQVLDEHRIQRMFVGQFEFSADHTPPFHEPPEAVVASLNTHDTATAAGFWYGDDIEDRAELGLLDSAGAAREREGRRFIRQAFMRHLGLRGFDVDPETQFAVLVHWLEHLASSRAACVLINLEDLLQERGPQNVPGTVDQRPNWRRRIRVGFEELCSLPRVVDTLQRANRARKNSRRAEGEL